MKTMQFIASFIIEVKINKCKFDKEDRPEVRVEPSWPEKQLVKGKI